MIKRTDEEMQAYVDGYNACFEKFRETLLQRNTGADKAIRKMEMLKEAVNSVLLTENVGTCQQNVGTKSENVTNGDMIKALYPNIEEERIEDIINIYSLCVHSVTFDTEWWDKPYFAGKENESEGKE